MHTVILFYHGILAVLLVVVLIIVILDDSSGAACWLPRYNHVIIVVGRFCVTNGLLGL